MNKYRKPCLWILDVRYTQSCLDLIKVDQFQTNLEEGGQLLREYTDESQDIYGLLLSRGFEREFEDSTDKLKYLNHVNLSLGPFKEIPLSPFNLTQKQVFIYVGI